MLSPLPLFRAKEWGTHRQEGHHCPSGDGGTLEAKPICPHCISGDTARRYEHFVCRNCGRTFSLPDDDASRLRLVCNACGDTTYAGWFRHVWHDEQPAFIQGLDVRKGPLFHTIQHYVSRSRDGSVQLADFYLDIDRDDFTAAASATHVVADWLWANDVDFVLWYSGKKGFHIQIPWQVVGATPAPYLHQRTYKKLARLIEQETGITPDYSLYSHDRMLRVPNTQHASTGLYKVQLDPSEIDDAQALAVAPRPVVVPDPLRLNATLHALYEQALAQPDPVSEELLGTLAGSELAKLQEPPACVAKAWAQGPPAKGTRHRLNLNMAAFVAASGGDPQEYLEWARSVPGASKTPAGQRLVEARSALRWAQEKRPAFSCRTMQDLGLCDPSCAFYTLAPKLA